MARFGVKEVVDGTFYDLVTGKPVLFLDSLKMSNLENEAETSYINGGKGNPRLMSFDYNRTATFTMQDALMNPKAIAMQTGTEVVTGAEAVHKREVAVAVASTGTPATTTEVTLAKTPLAKSVTAYITTNGYDHGLEVVATIAGNKVTFPIATVTAGTQVVVYYQFTSDVKTETVTIKSDKFAGFYKFVGETVIRNLDTKLDEPYQVVIPKAKITSQFAINMSPEGEASVFDFNLDVFKADGSTDMVKLIKY